MREKGFLKRVMSILCAIAMLLPLLTTSINADVPDPLPEGVNPGYNITNDASFTDARGNSYLIGGGNVEYTTLADDPANEVLHLTANPANTDRYQWDFAFLTKDPLSVGGIYEVSYKIFVPEEAGKGGISAQIMREDKWGHEVPSGGVPITKGEWLEVKGTLEEVDSEFNEIRFLLNYDVANLPTEWYMDDIKITLVDYNEPGTGEVAPPNAGIHITFDEAIDRVKVDNEYIADAGGTGVEWVTGATEGYNNDGNALKCSYDSTKFNQSWKGAYNLFLKEPISVNGTYKISYQVYVPSEGNEDKDNIRAGFVVDNGFGNGYGVAEFPVPDATITKDQWVEVSATLPKTAKATNWFALRFTGGVENFPNVYYVDDFKIEMVDFDDTPPVVPGWEEDTASIKDTYQDIFKIGNILQAAAFTNAESEKTKAEFLKQYNVITLENAMKPDQLSNAKDVYDFTEADAMVDWANDNGLGVHGHVFVWHSQSPEWVNKGLTRAEAKENMDNYIKTVAEHFNGRVDSWDVVNEAFYNDALNTSGENVTDWRDGLRSIDLSGEPGSYWYQAYANGMDVAAGEDPSDFIYDAFVFARQYAPNTTLYYNDFNDDIPNKVNAICNMINDLNARWKNDPRNTDPSRLLVEGMGLQSHYSTTWTNDTTNVKNALEAYIATGVEIAISELDVSIENTENEMNTVENQQRIYNELFEMYTSPGIVEHISRVTFWGMHDGVSWRGAKRCLPFDLNQKAKPAYEDIIAIGENYVPVAITPEVSVTPEPSITPEVSATPEPSITPEVSGTPKVSATPIPSATATPGAQPSGGNSGNANSGSYSTTKGNTYMAPKTGDTSMPILYAGLALVGVLAIAGMIVVKKKKQ